MVRQAIGRVTIIGRGHAAITASHAKTVELVIEPEIGARATCVAAVGARVESGDLLDLRGWIDLTIEADGVSDVVRAHANPAFVAGHRLVVRREPAPVRDALLVEADRGAADLDPGLVAALKDARINGHGDPVAGRGRAAKPRRAHRLARRSLERPGRGRTLGRREPAFTAEPGRRRAVHPVARGCRVRLPPGGPRRRSGGDRSGAGRLERGPLRPSCRGAWAAHVRARCGRDGPFERERRGPARPGSPPRRDRAGGHLPRGERSIGRCGSSDRRDREGDPERPRRGRARCRDRHHADRAVAGAGWVGRAVAPWTLGDRGGWAERGCVRRGWLRAPPPPGCGAGRGAGGSRCLDAGGVCGASARHGNVAQGGIRGAR